MADINDQIAEMLDQWRATRAEICAAAAGLPRYTCFICERGSDQGVDVNPVGQGTNAWVCTICCPDHRAGRL